MKYSVYILRGGCLRSVKMKQAVIGLVLVGVACVVCVGYYFVGAGGYPTDPRAWTREMREARPALFAKLAEKAIRADLETIDGRLRSMRYAAGKISERYRDSSKKYEFGKKMAAQLIDAKRAGQYPVEIFGVEYEEFQLQSQMKLVCGELKLHAKMLDAVKKASELLEKEKLNLLLYRTNCKGQLDILQAHVEIFEARRIALDGLAILDECADVLLDAGNYLSKLDPVADIETLMKRAESEAAEEDSEHDLEAFMSELDSEEEADVAAAVAKAEDFSGLEAFVDIEATVDVKVQEKGKEKGKLPTAIEGDDVPPEPAL